MNPVAKLAFAVLFAIACFATSNPVFLACMLVFGYVLAGSCGMMKQALGLTKGVLAFSVLLAVIMLLTNASGDVLVPLPWGYIGTGGVIAAALIIVRLVAAAIALGVLL